MEKPIIYPTMERIIEYNLLALTTIKAKKADEPKVLSASKINEVILSCEGLQGDILDKAVCLLKGIIQRHPFASGNRRTAFIVVKDFLSRNQVQFNIKDSPELAKVLLGIREKLLH